MLCHTKAKILIPPPVFSLEAGSALNNWNHFSPSVCLGPGSSRAAGQHKPGGTTGILGTASPRDSGWGMIPKIQGLALLRGSEQLQVHRRQDPTSQRPGIFTARDSALGNLSDVTPGMLKSGMGLGFVGYLARKQPRLRSTSGSCQGCSGEE